MNRYNKLMNLISLILYLTLSRQKNNKNKNRREAKIWTIRYFYYRHGKRIKTQHKEYSQEI